uniref:Variant surface glycoprotein 1125.4845 n=1 Tax=Trypanosoma brucei TaxID=5691 RepID=A0A1J0RAV2_9TRYP|nr:variant surface glycoprotein 1125.4845 [Trypanosoma brucei]
MRTASAAIIAMSLIAAQAINSNSEPHDPEQIINEPCEAAAVLTTIAHNMQATLSQQLTSNKQLHKRLAQATAAANSNNGGEPSIAKAAIALLPSLAKAHAAEAEQRLTKSKTALPGLVAAANVSGQQAAIATIADVKVKSTTLGNAGIASVTASKANLQFEGAASNGFAKFHSKIHRAKAAYATWATPAKLGKYKVFTIKTASASTTSDAAPGVGDINSDQCRVRQQTVTQAPLTGTNNHLCVAGGAVLTTPAVTLDATTTPDYGLAAEGDYKADNPQHSLKQAAINIMQAATELDKPASAFDPDKLSSYIGDDTFLATVGYIYGKLTPEQSTGTAKPRVLELITTHFGTEDKFKEKIWDAIEKIKVSKNVLGARIDLTIKDVSDMATAQQISLQQLIDSKQKTMCEATKAEGNTTDKATEPPKTADEFKKHLTEKPCKDEKGCDFD